ncbi:MULTISPECIES: TetR family transcriptional regulator C-terminal domain-containing protein [Alteromonas]|jgi:TetR/AcrR family transcriptional regulator|uniref:TetR family transcriptional regulator n=1 Tax=Alteromonas hispanica TaxID=315421 RepID=A0A6L9MQD3_9ALTE|nr:MULTISPECIES: TetR family transcriptional regulator C-terminal domain-containing protein [Alteromonas]APE05515.1 transcriptional regulator [Alteromonas sp. RW2A1]AUC88847.1 transcriptional regulator [Alteromonas sp. MB-3u-76]MAI65269.1 transcriptional regulator [Alteromonas sp.]NDW20342.1 TetR family transcriptional regulator [Alteromonas hispanica]
MIKARGSEIGVGAANRRKIIQAAEKCFAQFGLKGTAVQKIADEAGLPKTNVLYYFKSKQELYVAVLEETLSLWNSHFDKATVADDPADVLATYIAEKMEVSRIHPLASKIFAMEIINGAQNLSGYFDEEHGRWMAGRVALINAWISEGKLQPLNPEYLLYTIWASTQHYADFSAQITRLRGKKMTKADFEEATKEVVKLVLGGCGLAVPSQFME